MNYRLLIFDFLGVFVQPRSAAMLFQGSVSDGFVSEMKSCVESLNDLYTMVILSSSALSQIRDILSSHNITHCFADVISSSYKPDDIATFLQTYDVPKKETVLITDTVSDIRAAQHVGIDTIAVSWGLERLPHLIDAGATHTVKTPEELQALLSS